MKSILHFTAGMSVGGLTALALINFEPLFVVVLAFALGAITFCLANIVFLIEEAIFDDAKLIAEKCDIFALAKVRQKP